MAYAAHNDPDEISVLPGTARGRAGTARGPGARDYSR